MKVQEMFDKVALHLMTQGKKAMGPEEGFTRLICKYLADDGCKCAAGCLIPPEKYKPEYEGRSVYWIPYFKELADQSGDRDTFRHVLRELQCIHDLREPSEWKLELITCCDRWHLTLPDCLK